MQLLCIALQLSFGMTVLCSSTAASSSAYETTICSNVDAGPLGDDGAPYSATGSAKLSLLRQHDMVNNCPTGAKPGSVARHE